MTQSNNTASNVVVRNKGHQMYQKFSSWLGRIYSTELNPMYHLGGITVLMFTIACISGIYVFIFYDINPRQAWESVEAMSSNYFNGWMRNIHRYSSDLLVVFTLMHLVHTLITSKFKRLLSWIKRRNVFFDRNNHWCNGIYIGMGSESQVNRVSDSETVFRTADI
jgi:quinol-cytochrome oxidoreductase complex cytochrome b subunit